ncbi:MAG: ABC transporter substrate-binding protein [Defluviicoccus sp.]|nr:ABC transporter substrate-binding protein [Defluviicoccus sp.]MDE0385646.1 ABC transporter substrate-binding protein [Defluviicoccus sp.]
MHDTPTPGSTPAHRVSARPLEAAAIGILRAIASAAILGLAVATLAATSLATEPRPGGTLVVAAGPGLRHLNPAVQSGAHAGIGVQLFAGLVRVDDRFRPRPYLAERWEISEDGLSYAFHLVPGARFHDGTPITSEDVAFSLAVVKQHHPFGIAMFDGVEAVDTPDPRTAVIRLSKPHPALMQSLVPLLMPVIPKHVFGDGRDPRTHPMNAAPVGSGPFRFKEWLRGRHVILERNDDFFLEGRPLLERIVVRFFNLPSVRMLALEKGEVDYYPFAGVRFRDVPRLADNPDLRVSTRGYEAFGPVNYVEFNLRKPPFDDLRVRRAVAYAIDQDFMVTTLHGGLPRPGYGPLHRSSPFYGDGLNAYALDLVRARALLDQAGYAPDAEGVRFRVALDYPPFHADSLATGAEYIKVQLKKVGIAVDLRAPADFASWAQRIGSWDYQFTMNSHWTYPDPVIGVHRIYLCGNIRKTIWSNTQGYCNERVDALLREAGSTLDVARRKTLYGAFQRIVSEELPLYFINEEPYVTVSRRIVMDPPETVWGAMQPLDRVWLDR